LAGSPDPADYDAAYAALMATAAGRRFVAELTRRNRNADTQMLVGAMARVEAAIRGDPAPHIPAIVTRELTEVAAAIDRAAISVAAAQVPTAAILAAVERIQDIAFVLHERPVELTLCDALDAAVRDIVDAVAGTDADGEPQGLRRLMELLRALARRINAMIALALDAEANSAPAATPSDPDDADATLAAAVATLAMSMPPEPESESLRDYLEDHPAESAASSDYATVVLPSNSSPELKNGDEAVPDNGEGTEGGAPLSALEALSEEELLALFS
jgi:hypothetical protein